MGADRLHGANGLAARVLDRHARADREHTAAIRCARTGSRELTEITEGHGLSAACRIRCGAARCGASTRSEEHTSELQSLMRISYAVFCLKKKKTTIHTTTTL